MVPEKFYRNFSRVSPRFHDFARPMSSTTVSATEGNMRNGHAVGWLASIVRATGLAACGASNTATGPARGWRRVHRGVAELRRRRLLVGGGRPDGSDATRFSRRVGRGPSQSRTPAGSKATSLGPDPRLLRRPGTDLDDGSVLSRHEPWIHARETVTRRSDDEWPRSKHF